MNEIKEIGARWAIEAREHIETSSRRQSYEMFSERSVNTAKTCKTASSCVKFLFILLTVNSLIMSVLLNRYYYYIYRNSPI